MDHQVPIGLPSKAFDALTTHSGEAYYSDKCVDILCELIQHWIATTPAAPDRWAAADLGEGEDEYTAFTDADLYQPAPPLPAPPAASAQPAPAAIIGGATKGYQWKQLFLPNGTELRSIYCGRSVYAMVENEQIISAGAATTPSRLANQRGCGSRNAWKTVWICFPGSTRWLRADRCREAEAP
jgi:hypothetical protein